MSKNGIVHSAYEEEIEGKKSLMKHNISGKGCFPYKYSKRKI